MASFYEMPAISPTMELGILIEWKVKEGDEVTPQTVVAEIGTDKANMEAEVFDDGVILKLLVEEDDEIPPGYPILIWGKSKDEDISDLVAEFEKMKKDGGSAGGGGDKPDSADDGPPEKAVDDDAAAEDAAGDDQDVVPDTAPEPETSQPDATASGSLERTWNGQELPNYFFEPLGDARIVTGSSGSANKARVLASPLARAVAKDKGIDLSSISGRR